jgi:rfaE bifunctional protein nucleotidyltransferase chain/domain
MLKNEKIVSRTQIKQIVEQLKNSGRKIVFTNGCFDILHIGHLELLEAARQYGDVLIVGLNSDDSVRRLKGSQRPINKEVDRARLLAALTVVDYVVVFGEDTPRE